MSVRAVGWVLEHSEARLGARLVLLAIADHADHDGRNAYPSIDTLARQARLSRSQVIECVKKLAELGELTVEKGAGPKGKTGRHLNRYALPEMVRILDHSTPANGPKSGPNGPDTGPDPKPVEPGVDLDRKEPSTPQPKTSARSRNEPFDQLCEWHGIDPRQPIPDKLARQIQDVLRDLKVLTPDLDVAELRRRRANWPLLWPGRTEPDFTIWAMRKWWPRLDDPQARVGSRGADATLRQAAEAKRRREESDGGRRSPGVRGAPGGGVPGGAVGSGEDGARALPAGPGPGDDPHGAGSDRADVRPLPVDPAHSGERQGRGA